MMRGVRAQTRVGPWIALVACALAEPALAQQGWLPVISGAEAAPLESSPSALEQGWYPVLINPPKPTGAPSLRVSAPAQAPAAKAGSPPATPQRAAQVETDVKPMPAPEPAPKQASAPTEAPPKGSLAESYCANIADTAADARFAWQKRTLEEMEKDLERRIIILEKRTAEFRDWLARRDAFVQKAQESLVRIYARMRPDAAASQLAAMDEETAAAVLTKLEPRNASAILNEMPPGPAARLTMTIAGAARVPPEEEPQPAAGGDRS